MDIIQQLYDQHKVGQSKLWAIVKREGYNVTHNIRVKDIQEFYKANNVEQRYTLPKPIREFTHIIAQGPNDIHQLDLVLMDREDDYKYFLIIIDVFSRYAAVKILKTTTSKEVSEAIANIYATNEYLDFPKTVMLDQGAEFKGATKKLFEDHNTFVKVNFSTDKRFTSIVERMNKTIETPIFKRQAKEELAAGHAPTDHPDNVTPIPKWIDTIGQFIDDYNNRPHALLHDDLTPQEAMMHPESVVYNYDYTTDNRPLHKVGQYVKLPFAKQGGLQRRHMMETYSNRIYVVYRVIPGTVFQPTRYVIADADTLNILPMTYYRDELNPVTLSKEELEIERDTKPALPAKFPRLKINRVVESPTQIIAKHKQQQQIAPQQQPIEPPQPEEPPKLDTRGRLIRKPRRYTE